MTDPYGQHLGDGHDHREYGHSPQHATELCIQGGLSSQNVRRIVNHLAFLRIAMFRLPSLARRLSLDPHRGTFLMRGFSRGDAVSAGKVCNGFVPACTTFAGWGADRTWH